MKLVLSLTLISNAAVGAAVLEPIDIGPEDAWKSVYWCANQRDLFRVGKEYWAVYEAVSLRGALPTKENCQKASEDPEKVYVGLFILRYPYAPWGARIWESIKDACPSGDLHFGQIEGFVSHGGRDVPFMRKSPLHLGACGKKVMPRESAKRP